MRIWVVLLLMTLLWLSAVPAYAWHGWHGYRWHGYRRPHVFIAPRVVVPLGPLFSPYIYPPLVVAPAPVYVRPSPPIVVQPSPHYWYYCDHPQGYYPYVQHCPGGWRQVAPTPQ